MTKPTPDAPLQDPDLARLVAAWPALPSALRRGAAALIAAAGPQQTGPDAARQGP